MLRKWYLNDKSNIQNINSSLLGYGNSVFGEALETSMSDIVSLYKGDELLVDNLCCFIQGNSPQTQLASMERIGIFPIGTVKAGMYVYFENRYWIITSNPSSNKVYEKVNLSLCQYKIRWQNKNGQIIERWASIESASKYDVGESGNNYFSLSSDNLTITLPSEDSVLDLYEKRVFVDKRIKPVKTYKLTRSDDVLFDYGENYGGVISFIADKSEYNPLTDNQELRICDYVKNLVNEEIEDVEVTYKLVINSNMKVIKPFTENKVTFTTALLDAENNEVTDTKYFWTVNHSLGEYLTYSEQENGKSLIITLSKDCEMFGEKIIVSSYTENGYLSKEIEIEVWEDW